MSETKPIEREQPDPPTTDKARESLEQAEAGDASGVAELDQDRGTDPAGVEAAEQEASDGPDGRGLSR